MSHYFKRVTLLSILLVLSVICAATDVPAGQFTELNLSEFSIEELLTIEVFSVSKKAQKISDTAAAVFVITGNDIRRSGATSIAEALKMVPGLQVARINSSTWAVTSRGFNGRFANKLLVLIDGRSVYSPLFSGVFWAEVDTLLEDVERIEVVRGPGATMWGANAVNGIINIITKKSSQTQGGLLSAGIGSEEERFGGFRYGGELGDHSSYRAYVKYFKRDSFHDPVKDADADDEWDGLRAGFRMDLQKGDNDSLSLQADYFEQNTNEIYTFSSLLPPFSETSHIDIDHSGVNILAKWNHTFSPTSDTILQLYYDRNDLDDPRVSEIVDTIDLDFQHNFSIGEKHEITWGLGYRFISDEITGSFLIEISPDSRDFDLFSAYIQDDIQLVEDRFRLTIGSKFEHNDFTGFEIQPTARLLWLPAEKQSSWASVSRAVRTPSRIEADGRLNQGVLPPSGPFPPKLISLLGNDDYDAEELYSFEVGYRNETVDNTSFDITMFYNIYDNLRTLEPLSPFLEVSQGPMHLAVPFLTANNMEGETYGVEISTDWHPLNWWRLQTAYTYLQMQLHLDSDSGDIVSEKTEGDSPHNQISLRSSMDLPREIEFDVWLRYVDDLPAQDLKSYITMDVRLGWSPLENLELMVVGQNLLDNHHPEFKPEIVETSNSEIERSVYGKITWKF